MCLIIPIDQEPILLKEDLTVYKCLYKNGNDDSTVKSACMYFKYRLNRLYATDMEVNIPSSDYESDLFGCYNNLDYERIVKVLPQYELFLMGNILPIGEAPTFKSISVGYHSFLSIPEDKPSRVVIKCTIPAGSLVYFGIDNVMAVSDKLIMNEILEK